MYNVISDIPDGKRVAELRRKTGLKQAEMGALMGYDARAWMRREAHIVDTNDAKDVLRPGRVSGKSTRELSRDEFTPLKIAEYNLLLLIADAHPGYRLSDCSLSELPNILVSQPATPADVKLIRQTLGLTIADVASLFGYKPDSWKSKQAAGKAGTLTKGEYNFMLLLGNIHPNLNLIARQKS